MKEIKIKEYQMIADDICNHFDIKRILCKWNPYLKTTLGLYYRGNRIELHRKAGVSTLLHELAHHLRSERFRKRVPGFFLRGITRKMELDHIDARGRKWYSATGPLEEYFFYKDRPHSNLFKKCLSEIEKYFYGKNYNHKKLYKK